MKHEPLEKLLDACLGEALGLESPPNVANRVLKTWAEREAEINKPTERVAPIVATKPPEWDDVSTPSRPGWLAILAVLAAMILIGVAGPWLSTRPNQVAVRSSPAPANRERLSDAQVIAQLNAELAEAWRANGITPAVVTSDAEWCRRVFLRLIGRIPSVDELNHFVSDPSSGKRATLVDTLLADAEWAANWADVWCNILIGRSGGTEAGDLASREGLRGFLQTSLRDGRKFSAMARDLIAATGASQPGDEGYHGAVNFLLASYSVNATLATSRTSRVFLGQQLHCVECHDHPTNEDWKQHRFWELNACFRQLAATRGDDGVARLLNRDFAGQAGDDPSRAGVAFETLSGRQETAYPALSGAPPISPSGRLRDVDRRAELAGRIVVSHDFSRAVANRVWSHFFGYGFTQPVDDMGPHNPPSHPELLTRLAEQFAARDYELRDLVRWIVLSEAFGLSSKLPGESVADAPDRGGRPLFSYYYSRHLQPEEVYKSLLVVAAQDVGRAEAEQTSTWLGQFARPLGTDDGEEFVSFTGEVNRSLVAMHGPLMEQVIGTKHDNVLRRVIEGRLTTVDKVEHLFLAAVARKPADSELALALNMLDSRPHDPASVLQDVWWALLNSNEFILDH